DKGHWQSEDPVHCLTSVEAWNFMKRWSLGPDAPKVTAVEPENSSFDLPLDGVEITLTFDMNVEAEGVEAQLVKDGTPVNLEAKASENVLTLTVPPLEAGEYNLSVRNVKGENDGVMKVYKATYIFGVEEVGDVPPYNVIFHPDLRAEQNTVGEGIPTGWYRINTRANGQKDEKESGSTNTGGARMKYFMEGGDFDEGFYLSARDYDRCEITYGRYVPDYALHFEKGRYVATFNSVFWNEGSLNNKVTFDFTVKTLDGTPIASFPSLPSSQNMNEQTNRITDSYYHICEFDIPETGDYTVTYSMTAGWAAVIVGNLEIATAMSTAERYKGTFQRTLAQAKEIYANIPAERLDSEEATALQEVIARHEFLISTSPSVYENATQELTEAIERAGNLTGISSATADDSEIVSTSYYNLYGQRITSPDHGVVIVRQRYANGTTKHLKIIK
ncbi:MAG: copper resistance protein CopC, partial [Muribaculaceae bacterium]|nr:copper resistance protein CopC [Muribaculaceae bacterium]